MVDGKDPNDSDESYSKGIQSCRAEWKEWIGRTIYIQLSACSPKRDQEKVSDQV